MILRRISALQLPSSTRMKAPTVAFAALSTFQSSFSIMASASALSVSELAAKPFVQRSMASPNSPQSVLSFFYGVDFDSPSNDYLPVMREGVPMEDMQGIWYSGGDQYDKMCQAFIPTIRAVVGNPSTPERMSKEASDPNFQKQWNDSVDGLMSQVLLCDQLSRNAFRGTEEAFQHDATGEKHVQQLIEDFLKDDVSAQSVPGEIYPPYVSFLVTACMHSENIENHTLGSNLLEASIQRFQDKEVAIKILKFQEDFLNDHRAIVERFGRYPHRNSKLGRETTPKEQAWLDDEDNLPGWAKSQG